MKGKDLFLMAVCILMLVLFARCVPSGAISQQAQMRYVEESTDDEYDFL